MRNITAALQRYYNKFWLDLIFPKRCFDCGEYGCYLCSECFAKLPRLAHQRCIVCQKPSLEGFTHPKCQTKFTPDRLVTLIPYQNQVLSKLIRVGKYQFVPEIFRTLAKLSAPELVKRIGNIENYEILAIPLHKKKLKWRGFNQAHVIGLELSKSCNFITSKGLRREKFTKAQMNLNAEQRKSNLKHSFVYEPNSQSPINLLLVDDVTTTGSTFLQATKAIRKSSSVKVTCFAITQD